VSGQLHAPAALPPGKSSRYPFYRRLGGPQSRSGRYEEVNIFYPTGTRTPAPQIVQYEIESINKFIYLGNMINETNSENQEIQRRINYANGIYFYLMCVFKSQNVHRKTKIRIYKTIIKRALMYGCETWSLLQNAENKLGAFERKILRRIYGPINANGQWRWRCRYDTELDELYKDIDTVNDIKLRRLQRAGHVVRMP
jgi:hypothetical protein